MREVGCYPMTDREPCHWRSLIAHIPVEGSPWDFHLAPSALPSDCCAGRGSENARHFLLIQKRMSFSSSCSPFSFHSPALDSVPHLSFQAPVGLLLSAGPPPSVCGAFLHHGVTVEHAQGDIGTCTG